MEKPTEVIPPAPPLQPTAILSYSGPGALEPRRAFLVRILLGLFSASLAILLAVMAFVGGLASLKTGGLTYVGLIVMTVGCAFASFVFFALAWRYFVAPLPPPELVNVGLGMREESEMEPALDWTTGYCPVCGYDLRATPDCCPECGTVKKEAAV
jgi:hypothetical protein